MIGVFIFCLMVPSVRAQLNDYGELPIDTVLTWIHENVSENDENIVEIAHYALKQVLKDKNFKSAAVIHSDLSYWNYINYQINGFDSIEYHRIKQIEYDTKLENMTAVGEGYIDLAIDYMNDNQLNKSQDALFKSIEIFESLGNESALAEAHANLAYLYIDMNNFIVTIRRQGYPEILLSIYFAYLRVRVLWRR